jgi:hypothetical protein
MADAFVVDQEPERVGAQSLFNISMDKLRKNIHLLWETNDTPTHILMPLVTLVQNPEQLGAIEESSPHLQGQLGQFWLRIIKRNIIGWEDMLIKNRLHSDGRKWTEAEVAQKATYRTYRNCVKKMKQEDALAEEHLRAVMGQASAAQREKETTIIEKLPPGYLKTKKRTGGGYDGTSKTAQTGELRFGGGSRTKANTGKGFITKMRRELKEARFMKAGGSLATPTHLLQEKAKFLPQGVDKRFEVPQSTGKRTNLFRLTARPLPVATKTRLSSATPAGRAAITLPTTPKPRLLGSSSTKPSDVANPVPQRSLKRSRPVGEEVDEAPPTRRTSPPAPRNPFQRKKAPPTVLMPPRRTRPGL